MTDVLQLAHPATAGSIDAVIAAEAELARIREDAIAACTRSLDALPGDRHRPIRTAIKQLRQARAPSPIDAPPEVASALADVARLDAEVAGRRAELASELERAMVQTGETLRAAARSPRFREAVTWQNRQFLQVGVEAVLRRPAGSGDTKTRYNERTLASYLQRYATKSETIGFFGPVGWGTFADVTDLVAGPSAPACRTVYFEHWGIARVAAVLAETTALAPAFVPRRSPTIRLAGTTLHYPVDKTSELPPEYARVIAACDGERTARGIADQLSGDPASGFVDAAAVYDVLRELVELRVISWTLEIPTEGSHPELALRTLLERADAEPRQAALAVLGDLEARRAAVARASGDSAALAPALDELQTRFHQITGTAGSRGAGESYAGRGLVYEDCVRDVRLQLGAEQLAALATTLAPVLASARWFTYAIAERYRAAFVDAYRTLQRARDTTVIDYLRFWSAVEPQFGGDARSPQPIVREVVDELHRRWAALLLGAGHDERRVAVEPARLRSASTVFDAPHPGWPAARHHAPDVIVGARSIAAMRGGDVTYVLGELHVGDNTLGQAVFVNQHPDVSELIEWMEQDLAMPRVSTVLTRDATRRVHNVSLARFNIDVETGAARSRRSRDQVIGVGELVVEMVGQQLVIRTIDGRHVFDAIAFFEQQLQVETFAHFSLIGPAPHVPRVTADKLVLVRERWVFAPEQLAFAELDSATNRLVETRRWASLHGLPRFVFFKVPEEPKPCYLDLASPILVEVFCKLVRKASRLLVSEMLPTLDDCWLIDADGQRYVSELRIVAVDPRPWSQP